MKTGASNKSFYIPEGMTLTGTFTADGPGQIAGVVNGDVFVNGRLVILKNAEVYGNIKAKEIEVWGKVIGFIQCTGKLYLQQSSFIKGNIRTVEIKIENNAVVDGIIIEPGQNNTRELLTAKKEADATNQVVDEPVIPTTTHGLSKVGERNVQSWF